MNVRRSMVFILSVAFISSCAGVKNTSLGNSTVLSYDIVTSQKSIRMNATITEITPNFQFKYVIENEDLSGKVTTLSRALESSNEIDNIFNGEDKVLSKSTTLRLSDTTFKQLLENGEALIAFRQGFVKNEIRYKVVDNQRIKYNFNGKPTQMETLYLEDVKGKGFKFWIWNNANNPLILRLDLGWHMVLTNIQTGT